MTNAKHTPGPWEKDGEMIISGDGTRIARVFGMTHERERIARLIAAAPELLAALENLVETRQPVFRKYSEEWEEARAAIAKARESEPCA